jgi:hypothetical protein
MVETEVPDFNLLALATDFDLLHELGLYFQSLDDPVQLALN